MTIHASNPTFAATLAQTLVNRGLGFEFHKLAEHLRGVYVFEISDDRGIALARSLAAEWGVSLYEDNDSMP